MNRKHVAIMLCGAAVAYACAPRNRAAGEDTKQRPVAIERTTDSSGLALTIAETQEPNTMAFELQLTNNGKLTEVKFENGRTHDFVVLDERSREVWRWSDGRLFTQALQTKLLRSGDALRYSATWDTAPPGRYRVIATLNSRENTRTIEKEFIVN
jgi:hypothetical protein